MKVPISVAVTLVLLGCGDRAQTPNLIEVAAEPSLVAHSKEFRREVVKVAEGVHVAVGYGLANSILVEGRDGVVIVDTMESAEAAAPVKAAFDRISSLPVRAIIYTHNHADHVFGARIMAGDDSPEVWSHASTPYYIDRIVNVIYPSIYRRSMRQFGTLLPAGGVINAGIGPRLIYGAKATASLIRPDRTFAGERTTLEIAGIRLELVHAPGETPDQIFVWLPDERILLCGDNFYRSFPNLYAIRGTSYRNVMDWVHSLDKMRDLHAAHLVPSHTRPISGEQTVAETLTDYRDAIQFVHDQTVRAMNDGLSPAEIVERVKLPRHLASKPYLHEYYGRVDWSVRSIFSGYLGWFTGDAVDLSPLSPTARARRLAALAGGRIRLVDAATAALEEGDNQWALELASSALTLADDAEARSARSAALRALGAASTSANARSYYLTQALEATRELSIDPNDPATTPRDLLEGFPIANLMAAMAVHLDADRAGERRLLVAFNFTDTGEHFTIELRRGIAEIRARPANDPDITVSTETMVWKETLTGRRNSAVAFASGAIGIEGSAVELAEFLLLFRPRKGA